MTTAPADTDDIAIAASARHWVLAKVVLTGVALLLLFAILPHAVSGDGAVRLQKLQALLTDGTWRREPYSLVGPLFASPLWWLGGARLWWLARFNVLVLATGVAAAWFALRPALTAGERASALLLLVAGGMMPNATLDFYGEMFSAVMVGTGLMLVWVTGSRAGWIPIVLGVANLPASAAGLLLVAIHRFWRSRQIDGFVALALAGAAILLENTLARGAPLDAGYANNRGATTILPFSGMPGFSYPLILGVVSLLFSFGKGLLFFAPGLLLVGLARRERPQLAPWLEAALVFVVGLLLVYAKWWAWYGGWKWGPRFLLFAAYPSSIALAVALARARTWRRGAIAIAVSAWTLWVGVSGAVFDLSGLDDCLANGWMLEHLCWYVPEYSPLLRPLVLPMPPLATWQRGWMVFAAVAFAVLITSGPSFEHLGDVVRRTVRTRARRR